MNSQKLSPKMFFIQIGAIISLYISFATLLVISFRIIDEYFRGFDYYAGNLSWLTAVLIVIFPVHVILIFLQKKEYEVDPELKNKSFRYWMVYLTLFLSIVLIIGNLITVLYFFFDGQILTLNFILKSLVLFLLSLLVLSFYYLELKDKINKNNSKIFLVISLLFVIGTISFGFYIFGSPVTQRYRRLDITRVQNLQQYQNMINDHYRLSNKLPENLSSVANSRYNRSKLVDPETEEPYHYEKISDNKFKLCANFKLSNKDDVRLGMNYYSDENWLHDEGYQCFEREIVVYDDPFGETQVKTIGE